MHWEGRLLLIALLFVLTVLLFVIRPLVLRGPVCVGLLEVQIGENEIKNVSVPVGRSPLDSFLDILMFSVSIDSHA